MKKSKRFLCMLIAAVMLLGAFPAHAASAPPAATYKAASPTRLPDGTTGATAGMTGATKMDTTSADELYGARVGIQNAYGIRKYGYLINPIDLTTNKAKVDPTVAAYFDPTDQRLADFAGAKIPAGRLVDVYYGNRAGENAWKFICQYDARGMTEDLVIPCAPGQDPSKPQPKKAPAQPRTSFADVQPGSKYYDAVTTLAKNRVLLGVFDEDPNGNLKVNAPVSRSELDQLTKRLQGVNTEEYVWERKPCSQTPNCAWGIATNYDEVAANPNAYDHRFCTHDVYDYTSRLTNPGYVNPAKCTWKNRCGPGITRLQLMKWVAGKANDAKKYGVITPEQAQLNATRLAADMDWIETYAHWAAKYSNGGIITSDLNARYENEKNENLVFAWNAAYTDGATEAELADGSYLLQPMTRGDVCLLLYRVGLTQFGQTARK